MTYVIAATYTARPEEAEAVAQALERMVAPTLAEPGCLVYRAHRSIEDPNVFFIYEEYIDPEGFMAHSASPHFERHIRGEAWPRLANRTVVRAHPLQADG